MNTVLIEEISGYQIVIGFDRQVVDPIATKNKVNEILENDEKFLSMAMEIKELSEKKAKEYNEYWLKARTNATLREKASYDLFIASQLAMQNELVEKHEKIIAYRDKITKTNRIYFEPKKGEIPISDEKFKSLKSKEMDLKFEKLLLDGSVLKDFRGVRYFIETMEGWEEKIQKDFGPLPNKAIIKDEQIPEYVLDGLEKARIRKLTDVQKEHEISILTEQVLHTAAIKMNEMELLGETDSRKKATKWFEEEKEKIEQKYKM